MKKRLIYLFLIGIFVLFSTKIIYAENKNSTTIQVETLAKVGTETPTTTTTSTYIDPTKNVVPVEIIGITDNPLFKEILLKREAITALITEENQVCANIKEQEKSNKETVSVIVKKSKAYSSPYTKIINEIKSLFNSVKDKRSLNLIELNKNNKENSNINLEKEVENCNNQISNLVQAIKSMRESIKYISLESVEYNKKITTAQQQIDKTNQDIMILNKKITEDKLTIEKELENFSTAMYNKDLKTANTSYGKIVDVKKQIVNNYKDILNLKSNIKKLLLSVEA